MKHVSQDALSLKHLNADINAISACGFRGNDLVKLCAYRGSTVLYQWYIQYMHTCNITLRARLKLTWGSANCFSLAIHVRVPRNLTLVGIWCM